MDAKPLEERVHALEREVAELKNRLEQAAPAADWRRTVSTFRGDATFHEIVDAGKAIREAERTG